MITALVALVAFAFVLFLFRLAVRETLDRLDKMTDALSKEARYFADASISHSQSLTTTLRNLLTPRPASYTLMVEAKGVLYSGKKSVFEFGRIGSLKPGETREESFYPNVPLTGGRFVLIAPDDVFVRMVYVGNDVYTLGESQLRHGKFPACGIATKVRFLIERQASA